MMTSLSRKPIQMNWVILIVTLVLPPVTLTSVCTTDICKMKAQEMIAKMNRSAPYCENFYEAMCGAYVSSVTLPRGKMVHGTYEELDIDMLKGFRHLMNQPVKDTSSNSFEQKMKKFYKSCMDTDTLGKINYKSSPEFLDWPTLNKDWTGIGKDYKYYTLKYEKILTQAFFTYDLGVEDKKRSDDQEKPYHLKIISGSSIVEIVPESRNSTFMKELEKYYIAASVHLGADPVVTRRDAKEWIDFYYDISKIPLEGQYENVSVPKPFTVEDLNREFPYFDWQTVLQAAFPTKTISLCQTLEVVGFRYFKALGDLLNKTNARVIGNFFGFMQVRRFYENVFPGIMTLHRNFLIASESFTDWGNKEETCLKQVNHFFNRGMSRLVANEKYFATLNKKEISAMIKHIKQGGENVIKRSKMNPCRKARLAEKLWSVKEVIGLPDDGFDNADLDEYYDKFVVNGKDFYQDYYNIKIQYARKSLENLHRPYDIKEWKSAITPTSITSYYNSNSNTLFLPLGTFIPPNYHRDYPKYLNYGSLGYQIGYALAMSVDDEDNFNKTNFENNKKCFIDQYSSFYVDEVKLYQNAEVKTQQTSRDNAGFEFAFAGYKDATKNMEDEILPGLNLNQDQLFFAQFAGSHCAKYNKVLLKQTALTYGHSTPKYRVIGTIQNTCEFARLFTCTSCDYMDRSPKCKVFA